MEHFDCVIVLGCAPRDKELERLLHARINKAVSLHKKGVVGQIVLSGGKRRTGIDESKVMAKILKRKLSNTKPILENESGTTHENALNSLKIVKKLHLRSIIVVTNSFHMPRARFIFNKVFQGYKLRFEPADDSIPAGRKAYLTLVELGKLIIYFIGVR